MTDDLSFADRASRRDVLRFLATSASVLAFSGTGGLAAYAGVRREEEWDRGELAHLIPSVNHSAFLIKTSFHTAQAKAPVLKIGSTRSVKGEMTDSTGHFWQFYARELDPGTTYEWQLRNDKGGALADPWPLSTFPHPDADPDRLRIFAYTCAGGNERPRMPTGEPFFLSLADRRRLMQRGLDFNPDVVIANGDHIYWDQDTLFNKPLALQAPWLELFDEYGSLDRNIPAIGTSNEAVLKRIVNDQIATLYGVMFRSVPVYMLTDDHDMFENDEANDQRITLKQIATLIKKESSFPPEFSSSVNNKTKGNLVMIYNVEVGAMNRAPMAAEKPVTRAIDEIPFTVSASSHR